MSSEFLGRLATAGSTATRRSGRKGCLISAVSHMDARTRLQKRQRTRSWRCATSTQAGEPASSRQGWKCCSRELTGQQQAPSATSLAGQALRTRSRRSGGLLHTRSRSLQSRRRTSSGVWISRVTSALGTAHGVIRSPSPMRTAAISSVVRRSYAWT